MTQLKIITGSDHAGFDLKESCRDYLSRNDAFIVHDAGVFSRDSSDYPLIAHTVAESVSNGEYEKGILICGTGLGISMAANRHKGIRAAVCHDLFTTEMARRHNDANILVMGARVVETSLAIKMINLFFNTSFEGGRHQKRIDLID